MSDKKGQDLWSMIPQPSEIEVLNSIREHQKQFPHIRYHKAPHNKHHSLIWWLMTRWDKADTTAVIDAAIEFAFYIQVKADWEGEGGKLKTS